MQRKRSNSGFMQAIAAIRTRQSADLSFRSGQPFTNAQILSPEPLNPSAAQAPSCRSDLTSDDREPFPIAIFVSSLAKMGIAFKARPCSMTVHAPYLRDAEAYLEESRNAIMSQVMEM